MAYDAIVTVPIKAGATRTIEIPVEFVDLEKQATGLLPGGFALYDADREILGEQTFIIDVRGSATSALGIFGIFITGATIVGIVGILLAVKRGSLGPNRVRRMVRFAFVGLGVGLTLVVALAVFRVVAPTAAVWIPLTIIPTLLGGALGFFSPGPLKIDETSDPDDPDTLDDLEDDIAVDLAAAAAAGPASTPVQSGPSPFQP